jgi:hypothetical protein
MLKQPSWNVFWSFFKANMNFKECKEDNDLKRSLEIRSENPMTTFLLAD